MLENGIPQGTQNFGIFDKYYPSRRIIRRIIQLRRGIRVWKWDSFSFWANNLPGHPYLVWFYSSHYFLILTDFNTDYPPTWNLIKQPTFREATNGFFVKWPVRNERRNSILMTCRYLQDGISALVLQSSICKETVGGVAKWRLFSQAEIEKHG